MQSHTVGLQWIDGLEISLNRVFFQSSKPNSASSAARKLTFHESIDYQIKPSGLMADYREISQAYASRCYQAANPVNAALQLPVLRGNQSRRFYCCVDHQNWSDMRLLAFFDRVSFGS